MSITATISILVLSILGVAYARPATLASARMTELVSGRCVRSMVNSVEKVGEFEIKSGVIFQNTTVGGLSAITYDEKRDVYYLLSDDREDGKHRFYTATIDLTKFTVKINKVTFFTRSNGSPFAGADLDPEGLVYTDSDTLIMSSERDPPAIMEFTLKGKLIRFFNVPDYYMANSDGTYGTRNNLGFEGLSLSPNGKILWAANEGALVQDGPKASLTEKSPTRIIAFNVKNGNPVNEYVYYSEKIVKEPIPADGFADNGITEIIALSDKRGANAIHFLAMERSFSVGATLPDRGYNVRLYEFTTQGAESVHNKDTMMNIGDKEAVVKKYLANMNDFGVNADNLEGLQIIKTGCGEAILIVMSDDNFSAFGPQSSQFIFLKLKGDF